MKAFAGFKNNVEFLDLPKVDKTEKKKNRPEVITSSTVSVPKKQRWKMNETKGLQSNCCSKYDYEDKTKTKQENIGR